MQRINMKKIYVLFETFFVLNFEKNIWLIYISKIEPSSAAIIFKFTTSYFLNIYRIFVMLLLVYERLS